MKEQNYIQCKMIHKPSVLSVIVVFFLYLKQKNTQNKNNKLETLNYFGIRLIAFRTFTAPARLVRLKVVEYISWLQLVSPVML